MSAVAAVRSRAVSIPAWLWLVGIVVVSAALRIVLARKIVAPWIMVDELIYSELAKSVAAGGHFLIRGVPSHGDGFVYPVLIAPAFRLFSSVPQAYAAAKAINSVLMSLAAVPAYLLARRVVRPRLALVAAALTVAVPSMVYTGTLMTENAFYPLFLTCALLLVLVLERPSPARIAALLLVSLLAFLTRAQAVALVPAILTAPLLLPRARWREFRLLYGVVLGASALALLWEAGRGRSPLAVLGAYRAATGTHYTVATVLRWFIYHVGELDLYVGVAPFAALLFLAVTKERSRPFLAAALPLTAWLVLEVAIFASAPSVSRIEERNMFFVAPLFFIALCRWIELGLPRPRAAGICAVAAAGLVGVVPYSGLINGNATSDTLALLPLWTLQDTITTLDEVGAVVLIGAIGFALLWLLVPDGWWAAIPVALFALFALWLWPIESNPHGGIQHSSQGALFGGTSMPVRNWIDHRVGRHANVAVLFDARTMDKFTVWTNEFFNRSVHRVYDVDAPAPGGLPETRVRIEAHTGLIRGVRAPYVLTSTSLNVNQRALEVDEVKGLALYRVRGSLGIASATHGIYADGWSGPRATYTRFGCHAGDRLLLTLAGDPKLIRTESVVAAATGGGTTNLVVPSKATKTFSLPLRPHGSRCVVRFRIVPVAQPAAVEPGSTDTRILGIRFLSLAVRTPRAGA